MTYILARPDSDPIWPFDPLRLREFYPGTIFGDEMTDADLADFSCFPVATATRPTYDSATQIVTEMFPAKIDGLWVQRWRIDSRPAPPAPEPSYQVFYDLLMSSDAYQKIRSAAQASLPIAITVLEFNTLLTDARFGTPNISALQASFNAVITVGGFTAPELASIQAILVAAGLDSVFEL